MAISHFGLHTLSIAVACALIILVSPATAQPGDFLRKVSRREVEADLQTTLADLLRGSSAAANARRFAIEASSWQTFQALPKNEVGRLPPPAVRYIVHSYFAKEHGWLIKGLEPHGMQLNASDVHAMNILQDKVPLLVENLLEAREANHGLVFDDVVVMIAVLEQLMFDESITLLQAAFRLNGLSAEEQISEDMLHTVLQSYLILFGQGSKANLHNATYHQLLKQSRKRPELEEFERDAVLNFEFSQRHRTNPFVPRQYSFKSAAEIMERLAQQYGKWQNAECRDMKAHLMELDPEGLGRVPLGLFYAQPQGSAYHFSESLDYLRKIGALDEASIDKPKVIITNYVSGPSNCIASSSYYSVCCLSECDAIFTELEKHILAPAASPERLLTLVSNMSERALSQGLVDKLESIARRHGGQVPLHGRLFAQWLHFAFPHECPFPSIVANSAALTPSEWLDGDKYASADERKKHIESSVASAAPVEEEFEIGEMWSDYEVLPVLEHSRSPFIQFGSGVMRAVVQLAAVCVVVRSAFNAWRAASPSCESSKKDDDAYMFSVRV
jgi:hypothetical protein